MDINLNINAMTCIRCSKCVKVCPSRIFVQPEQGGSVHTENVTSCIACGHCVAVCPTGAVQHSLFPPDNVHSIDHTALPTPEQILLLCRTRRSNRAFSKKPIPKESLDMILEASHLAPTASNSQNVSFTLITDPAKLHRIAEYTIEIFEKALKLLRNPFLKPILKASMPDAYRYIPVFERMRGEFTSGNDLILRKATAVLFIHAPRSSSFGAQDCNLAYQNGSLMAESLGVSQFYTGFVLSAIARDKKARLAAELGIKGKIHAGMALGMPLFTYPNYIDRKEIDITRI